jgi:simple sugar transport system substrate-binding protein
VGLDYAKKTLPGMELVQLSPDKDREVVGENADDAAKATADLLAMFPDLKGIAAFGSQGPIGAGNKLKELGRTDVNVVGAAIPSQAATLLTGGFVKHAYLWDPKDAGYALVAVAQRLLTGAGDLQGASFPGLGAAAVDTETRDIVFNKILDITADNADSFGF